MYFGKKFKRIISTYLSLVKMESCDAQAIVTETRVTLNCKGLDLQKLCGIGTDDGSVMVGGCKQWCYKKLKYFNSYTLLCVPLIAS